MFIHQTFAIYGAAPPAAGYTLNPADNTNMTLSNGDKTATFAAARSMVRSLTLRSSGKYYFEFSFGTVSASVSQCVGITGQGTSPPGALLGGDSTSVGIVRDGRLFYSFGGAVSAGSLAAANHIGALAFDLTAKLAWARDVTGAGGWIGSSTGADPAAGTNGLDFSGASPTSWGATIYAENTESGNCTINLGGSAFTGAVPSGFSAWG